MCSSMDDADVYRTYAPLLNCLDYNPSLKSKLSKENSPFRSWLPIAEAPVPQQQDSQAGDQPSDSAVAPELDLDQELLQMPASSPLQWGTRGQDKSIQQQTQAPRTQQQRRNPSPNKGSGRRKTKKDIIFLQETGERTEGDNSKEVSSEGSVVGTKRALYELYSTETSEYSPPGKRLKASKDGEVGANTKVSQDEDILSSWVMLNKEVIHQAMTGKGILQLLFTSKAKDIRPRLHFCCLEIH